MTRKSVRKNLESKALNKGKKRFILNKKNANMLDVDMHARRKKWLLVQQKTN